MENTTYTPLTHTDDRCIDVEEYMECRCGALEAHIAANRAATIANARIAALDIAADMGIDLDIAARLFDLAHA